MKKVMALVAIIIVALATTASAEVYLGKMSDYGMHNACGIFSVVNCINELGLNQVKLEDAVNVAKEVGWDPAKGGMTFVQAESLANAIAPDGVNIKMKTLDCDSLLWLLSSGNTLTVAVDSASLWNGTPFHVEDHLISILGVETDDDGEPIFSIVDSGLGFESMTMEQLESCTGDYIYGINFRPTEC